MRRFHPTALITTALLWASPVFAAGSVPLPVGPGERLTLYKVVSLATDLIDLMLGAALTITVGLIVYGGFRMAWSRGEAGEFKKGRDILYDAMIGLTVILGTGIIIRTIGSFAVHPTSILR